MANPKTIVVVGAGVAGLSTAWLLRERMRSATRAVGLTVLEARPEPGGSTRTEQVAGYLCEWGPNGFLDNEPATFELVRRAGLEGRLQKASAKAARRFIFHSGRMREVPTDPLGFLRSNIVPPWTKVRMGLEIAIPPRRDGRDETVYEFGRRRLGRTFADLLLDPMVSGIFAGNVRELSLAAAFPKMALLERDHGGLFRGLFAKMRAARRSGKTVGGPAGPGATLHTFRAGMGELPTRLAADLRADLRTSTPARGLERIGDRHRVHTSAGPIDADAVVLACPSYAAAGLVRGIDRATADALDGIVHAPVDVVCQGFRLCDMGRPLEGFGVLIPRREGFRSLGTLLSDCIFEGQAPAGHRLLRTIAGGACDMGIVDLPDDALAAAALQDLRKLFDIQAAPVMQRVIRHERGIAQYTVGHLARVASAERLERELPGLLLTGASYRGVSINGCIKDAFRVCERLWEQLHG